jgi:ribonuclease P protein component
MALPKQLRLPRHEFIITREKGKTYSQKLFSAVYFQRPPNKASCNHYAVVISLKIAKKATDRNRLKRLILSCLRIIPSHGYNIIIYPKKTILNLPYEEINTGLNKFISEIYS